MGAVYPWIAIFVLLVLGLLYEVRGIHEARIRRQLRREGVETDAVVIGHWVIGTPRSGNTYYVKYCYHDHDKKYQREEQVGSSRYARWPKGTHLAVRYLPQNPQVARIMSEKNHFLSTGMVMVALGLLALVLLAYLFL